jgi:hypothetical protein
MFRSVLLQVSITLQEFFLIKGISRAAGSSLANPAALFSS